MIHHPMKDPLPDLEVIVCVLPSFVLIHACTDDVCPEENLPALAEYLARVNYVLPNGNFDLSYDEGMVSFRMSELNTGFLYGSQVALASLVEYPEMIVRQYMPQMLEVMQGKDPEAAFEDAHREEE